MTDSPDPAARAAADPSAAALPSTPAEKAAPDREVLDPGIAETPSFGPVPVHYRHDGWLPDRQQGFIEMLADTGCVDAAARSVGMSRNSAYALRRRPDAQAFRFAWDAATVAAITRLADAALARAINGVVVPVFHGGEQIGERRQFNERLTMFLLRYRDSTRYGKWQDGMTFTQQEDAPAAILSLRIVLMARAAWQAFSTALDRDRAEPAPRASRRNRGRV